MDADASPAALTIRAMAMPTELAAFAANFILLEYMVFLPLKTFKIFSNNQKYCQRLCEDLVKERCIDLLFARAWGRSIADFVRRMGPAMRKTGSRLLVPATSREEGLEPVGPLRIARRGVGQRPDDEATTDDSPAHGTGTSHDSFTLLTVSGTEPVISCSASTPVGIDAHCASPHGPYDSHPHTTMTRLRGSLLFTYLSGGDFA